MTTLSGYFSYPHLTSGRRRGLTALVVALLASCATQPLPPPPVAQVPPASVPAQPAPGVPTPTIPAPGIPTPVIPAPTAPAPVAPAPPTATPAAPVLKPTPLLVPATFASLPGWSTDNVEAVWPAFLNSCRTLRNRSEWRAVCGASASVRPNDSRAIRSFFESRFVPHQLRDSSGADTGLVTGYYEPLLRGSRIKRAPFLTPLYGVPDDMLTIDLTAVYPELKGMRLRGRIEGKKVVPYPSRAEIEANGLLKGKEIVWVDSPMEAFFLQIQGSGRVALVAGPGRGETIRVGYADQNGHPYKSIGRWLVDRGEMTLEEASMQSIQAWAAARPGRLDELLNVNPSYVFFSESKVTDPSIGPNGALGVPLTPERSIAIDPQAVPLGAPVFLATTQPNRPEPLQRLVMAQDTGGAIRGVVRADYFWGFGAAAGQLAGRTKQQGRMWVLLPK